MSTRFLCIALAVAFAGLLAQPVDAASACTFTITGSTMALDGDCTTESTILVTDGMTLDGSGYTITAVDPDGGSFIGAVVENGGATANVVHLNIATDSLSNACASTASPENRLRGIMFDGASGRIAHNTVDGINKGASGCQEGNGIEVRNAPFNGTHPDTMAVEIEHNTVVNYQKTGIVANGDVDVDIHHNTIGESATQDNLAANSLQLGFGALGSVTHNSIDGNQWKTCSAAATAILVYDASPTSVSNNNIRGNSDVGIYIGGHPAGVGSSGGVYDNNRVFDEGADLPTSCYDYGIGNWGADNVVTNNKVRGFEFPYDGDVDGNNKAIPSPN